MSDQAVTDRTDIDAEVEVEARPRGRMSGKKLVLFFILPVFLLAMLAAGVLLSGLADPYLGGEEEESLADDSETPTVFYELPEMLVNLNSSGRKTGFLKLSISLELASEEDLERLEQVLPRVIDNFQVYLRELRVEDLSGSAGLQRLREELLLRVITAAKPAVVKDVLFKEMLVQ
jgi:flagellar FliL protein